MGVTATTDGRGEGEDTEGGCRGKRVWGNLQNDIKERKRRASEERPRERL